MTRKVSRYIVCHFIMTRPEVKRRQQKWVKFIKITRPTWKASGSSMVCSEHFALQDFCHIFHFESQDYQKPLVRDEIGITAIPQIHHPNVPQAQSQTECCMIIKEALETYSSVIEVDLEDEGDDKDTMRSGEHSERKEGQNNECDVLVNSWIIRKTLRILHQQKTIFKFSYGASKDIRQVAYCMAVLEGPTQPKKEATVPEKHTENTDVPMKYGPEDEVDDYVLGTDDEYTYPSLHDENCQRETEPETNYSPTEEEQEDIFHKSSVTVARSMILT